jgi:hypothetical protein
MEVLHTMQFVKCDNCDNLASAALSEAIGWNACGPCATGEAASLTEYMDYFEAGDGDEDEDWHLPPEDAREESKLRRASNRENSAKILLERGISFTSHNKEAHLVVKHGKAVVDFWPGTGKYIFRKTNVRGRGVFNLLNDLGVKSKQHV